MGRPRAFSEAAALDAAAYEFRVRGFEGTSTEQLCEATGIRRSSLYNAFESKDVLFERALAHYIEAVRELQIKILRNESASGAERLMALLDAVIAEEEVANESGHAAGCMVVQSLMSPGLRARYPRVQAALEKDLQARGDLLADAIRAGQSDGSLASLITAEAGALLVNTIISGLRVTAQTGVGAEQLRSTALAGLHVLLN